jgi:hypothetical protein
MKLIVIAIVLASWTVLAAELPRSVFDPMSYGAKGDGIANDGAAIGLQKTKRVFITAARPDPGTAVFLGVSGVPAEENSLSRGMTCPPERSLCKPGPPTCTCPSAAKRAES